MSKSDEEYRDLFIERVRLLHGKARGHHVKYKRQVKQRWNKTARDHGFKQGDSVYIPIYPRPKVGHGKAKSRYHGPWELGRQRGPSNFEIRSMLGEYKGMINVNQVKYFKEDEKVYDCNRAQELADEDPIFNIDLNKAKRFRPEIPDVGSNDHMLELTRGGWGGKICADNINKDDYPKWLVNLKKEPNAINQHFCLLHKHEYLALPAETWEKSCDQCDDLKEGRYVLFCYTCDIKICEECHQKKASKFHTRLWGTRQ